MTSEREAKRGRRLVLAVIFAAIAISAVTIVTFNIGVGPERLPQQIVRFLLTFGLSVFLYRGANWARLLWAFLSGLSGLLFLVMFLGNLNLLALIFGFVYTASAIILLFSPSVKRYFGKG